MKSLAVLLVTLSLAWHSVNTVGEAAHSTLVVSPAGPYFTIEAALTAAQNGDVIEVQGGLYPALIVDKSVTLEGLSVNGQAPVIDGGGQGTVVALNAPHITLRGFAVQGSGNEPDRDHAGILVNAPFITIENNVLSDVLFGIFVSKADEVVVRGNTITSKTQYDEGRKGDGIRLWYSARTVIENNHVYQARDVVMWYANQSIVRNNILEHGRYGIHLMYCDEALIENNQILNNSVGIYTMYSKGTLLRGNLIRGQRGPSGYALGFKDADDIDAYDNVIVDNRAGVFLDGAPFSPQGYSRFHDNVLAFNDIGVIMLPAVRGNTFTHNTFWENTEQIAIQGGGGKAQANVWQGNYWSDYSGYDADGDAQGDIAYTPTRVFENLLDREPRLRALLYSPAVQAIELAANAFPVLQPQPKLTDDTPQLQALALPAFAQPATASPIGLWLSAGALFGLGLLGVSLLSLRPRFSHTTMSPTQISQPAPSLQLHQVTKRYGSTVALNAVSFEVAAGEAIALWGANGAGKTTLLKAILGLIEVQGTLTVCGHNARQTGKAVRRLIGYVPQEAVFGDWSVRDTLAFYAQLKRVPTQRINELVTQLGLQTHAHKSVMALSGGLKQRLALALALLADPPILLLDEPTANLDARTRREYLNLLASLRQAGKTILFASHRLEEVESLADRVLVLEHGTLTQTLRPEALRVQVAPEVQMTLWVPADQRPSALNHLLNAGWSAHINGRGTVVVTVAAEHKLQPLTLLHTQQVSVTDFEVE